MVEKEEEKGVREEMRRMRKEEDEKRGRGGRIVYTATLVMVLHWYTLAYMVHA